MQFFKTKWIDDPSNNDHRYERVRVRRELRKLSGTKKLEIKYQLKLSTTRTWKKRYVFFF